MAVKLTEVWPAGSVTVAGTVRCDGPLEFISTVMFCVGGALEVTVPVTGLPVSTTLAGKLTLSVADSLLWTVIEPVPVV